MWAGAYKNVHEKDVPGFTTTHYYILKHLRAVVKKGLCFGLYSLRLNLYGHNPCLSPLQAMGAWSKYSFFPYGWHPKLAWSLVVTVTTSNLLVMTLLEAKL